MNAIAETMKTIAILAALCGLSACVTTPATVTVASAHGSPVSFTTGKDLQSTAKAAALSFAAWYLQQLTKPNTTSK